MFTAMDAGDPGDGSRESRGFGEFNIHRALLPEQLDALAKLVPGLSTQQAFVFAKLHKLAVPLFFSLLPKNANAVH